MSAAVEEVRLSLPHIELAAHLFGPEDGLPVIALHGWLDNANSFVRLAPKLKGLRIVALDMAGHGHSGHRPVGAGYALLQAQLRLQDKRKSVHPSLAQAVEARMKGLVAVSREAAELLAQRGLMPVPGGYTWRSDNRLTLASPLRLTEEQAMAFVRRVACPAQLVVAEQGMLVQHRSLLEQLPFKQQVLPGGHHLHLNDEAGAALVADCFNRFFGIP